MSKTIKILTIMICALSISNAKAQSLSGSRTVAAVNTVKTAKHTCSYVVAGGGLYTFATLKANKENAQQNNDLQSTINKNVVETTLYPNPFTDFATVTFGIKPDAPEPKITITDGSGRSIYPKFSITEHTEKYMTVIITTTNLKQGRYIIRIISGDKIAAVKAIKL